MDSVFDCVSVESPATALFTHVRRSPALDRASGLDAAQEASLRALQALQRFRGDASPATFASAIGRNVLREQRRKRRSRAEVPLKDGPAGNTPSPGDQLDAADLSAAVAQILAGFTAAQQQAFTLLRWERVPAREAARLAHCTEKALRRRAEVAVLKLRRALSACCVCRLDVLPGSRVCPAESEKIRCLKYSILQHLQISRRD